jgi:hypothetical protein
MPLGTGAGSLASRSTISITSERCGGESLVNALSSRKPSTVSLDGYPSFSLNSETDLRFFISRLHGNSSGPAKLKSMPRNNRSGKAKWRRFDKRLWRESPGVYCLCVAELHAWPPLPPRLADPLSIDAVDQSTRACGLFLTI